MHNHVLQVVMGALVAAGFAWAAAGPSAPPPEPTASQPAERLTGLAGQGVFVDKEKQEIALKGEIVFRLDDIVEYFCCTKGTAEHESIIASPANPLALRMALMLPPFRLQPGTVARWKEDGTCVSPTGPTVLVFVEYEDPETKKTQRVRAEDWFLLAYKDEKTGERRRKPMPKTGFIFAGGSFYEDPETHEKTFLALGDGALITNYYRPSSVIDNPQKEGADDELWFPNLEAIPPIGTKVTVIIKSLAPTQTQATAAPTSRPSP